MRVVLQRVRSAQVTIDGEVSGQIERGLLLLCAFREGDTERELEWMARKCVDLRIFSDDEGKMNRGLRDVDGAALIVSQFTLYGDTRKGKRPSFIQSARPERAERLYDAFCEHVAATGVPVSTGVFGANMQVELMNDGPVTLILDKDGDRT